jgi:hypothetical protein
MAVKRDGLSAEACKLWDVHKEHRERQGQFARGNDDEGGAADIGDPGATEVPEVDLKYAGHGLYCTNCPAVAIPFLAAFQKF